MKSNKFFFFFLNDHIMIFYMWDSKEGMSGVKKAGQITVASSGHRALSMEEKRLIYTLIDQSIDRSR